MIAATFVASRVGAQRPDTTFYITMQGQDTVAVEYYRRNDNTITGAWIQNQGGVLVHDYALVLGDDGWPSST